MMLPAELEAAATIPPCLGKCIHCGKDDYEGDDGGDEGGNDEEEQKDADGGGGEAAATTEEDKKKKKQKTKGDAAAASSASSFGPRTMILCTCCQVRDLEGEWTRKEQRARERKRSFSFFRVPTATHRRKRRCFFPLSFVLSLSLSLRFAGLRNARLLPRGSHKRDRGPGAGRRGRAVLLQRLLQKGEFFHSFDDGENNNRCRRCSFSQPLLHFFIFFPVQKKTLRSTKSSAP